MATLADWPDEASRLSLPPTQPMDQSKSGRASPGTRTRSCKARARSDGVPPVFIVVCNNTSTSELIYKYISGFHRENDDGSSTLENGRLALFRNYDDFGNRIARPNTILIDSAQLESGEALDKDFRDMASDEIERFGPGNTVDLGRLAIEGLDLVRCIVLHCDPPCPERCEHCGATHPTVDCPDRELDPRLAALGRLIRAEPESKERDG